MGWMTINCIPPVDNSAPLGFSTGFDGELMGLQCTAHLGGTWICLVVNDQK